MVAENIDLSHLTQKERDIIISVLDRNEKIRQQEKLRIQALVEKDTKTFLRRESIKVRTGEWMTEVSKPSFKKRRRGTDVVKSSFRLKEKPSMPYYEPVYTTKTREEVKQEDDDSLKYVGRKGGRKIGSSRRKMEKQVQFAKENFVYEDSKVEEKQDLVEVKEEVIPTIVINKPADDKEVKMEERSFEDFHHQMEEAYVKAVEVVKEVKEEPAVIITVKEDTKTDSSDVSDLISSDTPEVSDIPDIPGAPAIVKKAGFGKIKRKGSSRRKKDRPTILSDDNRDDIFASPRPTEQDDSKPEVATQDTISSDVTVVRTASDVMAEIQATEPDDTRHKMDDDIFKTLDNILSETPTYKIEDYPIKTYQDTEDMAIGLENAEAPEEVVLAMSEDITLKNEETSLQIDVSAAATEETKSGVQNRVTDLLDSVVEEIKFDHSEYISGESLVSSLNETHVEFDVPIQTTNNSGHDYATNLRETATALVEKAIEVAKKDLNMEDSDENISEIKDDIEGQGEYQFKDIPDELISDESIILSGISDPESSNVTTRADSYQPGAPDDDSHSQVGEKQEAKKKIKKVVKVVKKKIKKATEPEKSEDSPDHTSYKEDAKANVRVQRRRTAIKKKVVRKKAPDGNSDSLKTPEDGVET